MRNYRTHYDSNKYMKEFYSDPEHRKHKNEVTRECMRRHFVCTVVGGKRILLKVSGKRLHSGVCELCEDPSHKLLQYHHWDRG